MFALKYSATWINSQNGPWTGNRRACLFTVALANETVGILRYQLERAKLQALGAGFSLFEAKGLEDVPMLIWVEMRRKRGTLRGFFFLLAGSLGA